MHWINIDKPAKKGEKICKVIEYLIKTGIPVDQRNKKGETLLLKVLWNKFHSAVISASIKSLDQIATCLVKHGANIDAQNAHGDTHLHEEAFKTSVDNVEFLLKLGASVHVINQKGQTPLDSLLSTPSTATIDSKGFIKILKDFQGYGATIKRTTNPDGTMLLALARAIETCNAELVQVLLELGAEVQHVNVGKSAYKMPLMDIIKIHSSRNNKQIIETVTYIAQHGVSIDQPDMNGKTLCARIMENFINGNDKRTPEQLTELVHALVRLGADPNGRNMQRTNISTEFV